jgi:branched-chain amino acid transport system permease protein
MKLVRLVRLLNQPVASAWWAAYALLLLLAPLLQESSLSQTLLAQTGVAIIACLSYNLLLGQGGMLSFGHAVYSGIGAFLAMHTLNRVSAGLALPVSLIPLVGGVASMALGLLLGWVCTKKAGTAFAMITFGMGELAWAMALVFPGFFGGEAGISGNRVAGAATLGITFGPQLELNLLIALYTLVCTALLYAFTRTPLGRMLNAVRDNPERVAFVGYNPQVVRYLAMAIATFFAGVAGGLAALNFEMVTADVLSAHRSGAYLLFTVLGGSGYFFGPIIGAVLMVLAFVLLSAWTKAWLLYVGLMFVLMVMHAPGGIAALLVAHWQLLREGGWRRLGLAYLAVFAGGLVALAGFAALVELVYHLQQLAVLGPQLPFLGARLNVQQGTSWLGAAALLGSGLGLLRLSCRHWRHQLHGWQRPQRPGSSANCNAAAAGPR